MKKFEFNVDRISMPAVNVILELMYYLLKLELNVVGITMWFSVDHIISLALKHLREITYFLCL